MGAPVLQVSKASEGPCGTAAAVADIGPAVVAAVNFLLGLEASRDPFFISALRVINDGGVGPDNSAARMSNEVLRKGSK